ncbi:MAG: type II toxin-antitoxin system VapC family toxin [Shinella sp.]|jgi:predicted nucleic acid-binding protein|nr:type II toxin-antitoxin system VapC family toxin [Shinella sp.]
MPGFVVDASIVCGWVLPDEQASIADSALRLLQTHDAFAPDLLWHEVRNVLMMARRRKRIGFEAVAKA